MKIDSTNDISRLLSRQHDAIAEEWLGEVVRLWSRLYPGLVNENELRLQTGRLIDELASLFERYNGGGAQNPTLEGQVEGPVVDVIRDMSSSRAKQGFKPSDTVYFVFMLKHVCTRRLVDELSAVPADLAIALAALNDVLDRLSLISFESYVEARERVITQQSLSLQELSSPVIRLWDGLLLLPLVGVVDTFRARQVTERLLEAITVFEATVTIIDVTGVPVFDTSVARHIMKAIDSAQLLGSRIVMTGISPEGAQTLTKLGISFAGVISRATLRAGVAEAFMMLGRRVVRATGGKP
jgi:rsbT co-antagonist protein RsbR